MPSSKMMLYVIILARLVPLLLLASAMLIGTRMVHERFFQRRRWFRAAATIMVVLLGMAAIIPYTVAMSSLIGAELAFSREDWPLVAHRFQLYCSWGGDLNPRMRFEWATALMNTGRLEEAAPMMASAIRSTDPNVPHIVATFYLGSIQFQRGQLGEAEATLRSITQDSGNKPLRYYLLGRLAERRNSPAEALNLYDQSLRSDPTFRPSFYHLVRLLVRHGNPQMARQAAQKFAALNPQMRQDSLYRQMLVSLNRGLLLEDREFFRLAQ
jgi:tetratricopeptide (TPR) repeat protein